MIVCFIVHNSYVVTLKLFPVITGGHIVLTFRYCEQLHKTRIHLQYWISVMIFYLFFFVEQIFGCNDVYHNHNIRYMYNVYRHLARNF